MFFAKFFNYKPKGKAGQLGKMFALFRDQVLPQALRYGHVRTDVEATLSTMQDQRDAACEACDALRWTGERARDRRLGVCVCA